MNALAKTVDYEFPHKLGFLFERNKWRYKVAYGGRDGAKSHSFAGALILIGAETPVRVGCFREVQKSINDSVYQLLCDKIAQYGLGNYYEILNNEIRAPNGTTFGFSGLSNLTMFSIKSWEGLDVAWVEEAQGVSKRSWQILNPTIRNGHYWKDSPEIWVSFNPDMDTDDTYQRFVVNPPPDAKVVQINYTDNPWKSKALNAEREHMRTHDPDEFAHVYMGQCRPAVEGAIYYKEVSRLRSEGRLHAVPYDPMLKVHLVCDLGFNDYTSFLMVQKLASEIRIIGYLEDRQRFIPSYSQELKDLKYNFGTLFLPHDGKAKHLTGSSAEEQFRALGWTCEVLPDIGVENGIRKAREIFNRVHIDKDRASELLNRLGRYRRRVNAEGQASIPVHDDASHGADGFRYLAQCVDQMTNDSDEGWGRKIKYDGRGIV